MLKRLFAPAGENELSQTAFLLEAACRTSAESDEQSCPFIHCLFLGMCRRQTYTCSSSVFSHHTNIKHKHWGKCVHAHARMQAQSTHLSSCLSSSSWVRGHVDIPLPAFVRLLLRGCTLGFWNSTLVGKNMALSPCFLRLFPYLDNLVLRRVEKELTRSSAWMFVFIQLSIIL